VWIVFSFSKLQQSHHSWYNHKMFRDVQRFEVRMFMICTPRNRSHTDSVGENNKNFGWVEVRTRIFRTNDLTHTQAVCVRAIRTCSKRGERCFRSAALSNSHTHTIAPSPYPWDTICGNEFLVWRLIRNVLRVRKGSFSHCLRASEMAERRNGRLLARTLFE